MIECQVMADPETAGGIASIPTDLWSDPRLRSQAGTLIRIKSESRTEYLHAFPRVGATGRIVFVPPGSLGLIDGKPASGRLERASKWMFRFHFVFRTRDGFLTLVGLALGLIGLAAQAFNALSEGGRTIDIGNAGRAQVGVAGFATQALGLVLIFWRGVLTGRGS